uniref:Uncharacterized protein n=1 Tax=Alexandrium catenella TaxID=2925 RepID=A0A7S1SFJ8_ALECA|mmetsp:Transcript_9936/g.27043  ORF Transcript_9936/g.27043 Transcript_9936/m.27043 type:complete len:434 (+) Transcript_9936:98-1399(+)
MVEDKSVQQMQATGARVLHSSPGLAEKLVASGKNVTRPSAGVGRDDRDAMIADLQRQLDGEREKNRSLEDQYKYRVATFMKRETQTKNKIESLEKRLGDGPEVDEHSQRMAVIGNMHSSVVAGLECIQNNTAKILQDQEKDLMRAFRARLQEVSKDLEAQRSRKGEDSTQLLQRHRRVVSELHEAQELASTFDKKNQQLVAENQKLQEKLRTREDDRQALLRELVLSKKEVARLKAQVKEPGPNAGEGSGEASASEAEVVKPLARSISSKQIDQARMQQTRNRQYEAEVQYRETIAKLKRLLEAERRGSRSLKQQQNDMLQARTELEVFLRQCIDDVKCEITRQRLQDSQEAGVALPGGDRPPTAMSVHELSSQDRERVLELLLSQQRVVQLLYSKTFGAASPMGENPPGMSMEPGSKEDDFSWVSDIMSKAT